MEHGPLWVRSHKHTDALTNRHTHPIIAALLKISPVPLLTPWTRAQLDTAIYLPTTRTFITVPSFRQMNTWTDKVPRQRDKLSALSHQRQLTLTTRRQRAFVLFCLKRRTSKRMCLNLMSLTACLWEHVHCEARSSFLLN